jgi:arsenite methyltransferase
MNPETNNDAVRGTVREHYAKVAKADAGCCGPTPGCCGPAPAASLALGYSPEEVAAGAGANLGLGCGNPQAIAALSPGEVVLDLGSGAGFDAVLAARRVGPTGRVIGVDMTPEMIAKARKNVAEMGLDQVEFRLGEIEHLPVAEETIDAILSNCVINLSPDKRAVFAEAFRVLRPGGRLAISDVVAIAEIPKALRDDTLALAGCVAGAALVSEIESTLSSLGFEQVRVDVNPGSRAFIADWFPGSGAEDYVASAAITAVKPAVKASCCAPSCCA